MAFSQTTIEQTVFGDKRVIMGSYDGAGVTTGELVTGLSVVEFINLQANGAAVVADAPTINETLPLASGTVTLIFTSGSKGYWQAIGL
jgi:hypothetical protein